jgi:CubicO group peptidase (beta-lactamase class C family)
MSAGRLAEVTALMQQYVDAGTIAGAVAGVARRGQIVHLDAVGYQDLESRTSMTDRSLFRIYSMAKAVTSVAVMMLWEEDRFELDDPVSRYLPEFSRVAVQDPASGSTRPPVRQITVRDLILHTSGLNHRTSALYRDLGVRRRDMTMAQFIQNIVSAPLMEDPGTRYRYSEGTTVLGGLVEVWSGMPLDEFMDQRIFTPLRMVDTGFQVRTDQLDRLTTAYRRGDDGTLSPFELEEIPFTERPDLLEGAVGLVSTVPDYLRFAQMLLNLGELDGARLLRSETVEMMIRNGLSDEVLAARPGDLGWGLGNVNVVMGTADSGGGPSGTARSGGAPSGGAAPGSASGTPSVGEYGWDGSAGTIFWNDPATETVIVLMWQNSPANPESLRQRLKALVHAAIVD